MALPLLNREPPSQIVIQPRHHENYVVLPNYFSLCNDIITRRRIKFTVIAILFFALVYFSWPSDPDTKIVRMHLERIRVHTWPVPNIDITLNLTLKVHNVDVYSLDYRSLDVAVGYRGKRLGHVRSDGGHVRSMASSFVDAELALVGVRVFSDVVFLLEDLARGTVQFDTVTEVKGQLGVLFFGFPLNANVSCQVLVNTINQTIVSQNCQAMVRKH
ncbi:hypothetical protein HS088_TW12G00336 [Tripterygium wilfordii]|uniref:Late embryogenesis abundant protein LEA-2 subgroup domain-containing protein n=1 Tax=Tripterygium wilfordii TaxID=458696 RepID=A0A7J7CZ84_TRIWF|nr:uncharacterized protein LOC120010415 [Tripterygium wilfordii]KAF5739136.1 hypothetical protein HS088_TW12G00336 [Tripterygium wilfordii]